jgi:hypothetical protein
VPGDPYQCRVYAARCSALAKRAWRPDVRQVFIEMAETWNRLAAEIEADQPLLVMLTELYRGEPYDDLLRALNLRKENYS